MALDINTENVHADKFKVADTAQWIADNTFVVVSGSVVNVGSLTLVALGNADADNNFVGDWGTVSNIYNEAVLGADNVGNAAVAVGDVVYVDGVAVNVDAVNGVKFGIALDAVASGATTTVRVLKQ